MLRPLTENEDQKLGDLPGASSKDKIEVWLRAADDGTSLLELVEYSWGSGIGWYVQKRVRLDAGQMEGLKALLGHGAAPVQRPVRLKPTVVQNDNVIQLIFPE